MGLLAEETDMNRHNNKKKAWRVIRQVFFRCHASIEAAGDRFYWFEKDGLYLPAICFSCASIIFLTI